MDHRRFETVLLHLRKLTGIPGAPALSDGQLLERFAGQRDEAAFELLVRRHGMLVWNVCRRILGNADDADDAFQAVFLVLVRKATALDGRGALGPWLYGVAYRVALRARVQRNRQRDRDRQALVPERNEPDPDAGELRQVLDGELQRLPEKYRAALVLCDLQGRTHEEAAQELCWPLGTLKCRVLRGRAELRSRLTRRGLALSLPLLGAHLLGESALAQVPAELLEPTVQVALRYAASQPVPATVAALAEGVLRAMSTSKLKLAAAGLLFGLLLGGTGLLGHHDVTAPGSASAAAPEPAAAAPQPADTQPLEAAWADLAGDDSKALPAVLLLANHKGTVAFLKGRLKPVRSDAKRMTQLIADLDSNQFAVREKATEELENLGEYALPHLKAALDGKPALEVRKRVEALLDRLKSQVPPSTQVRSVRAIAVLERIGDDEARSILQAMARGRTKAWPTQEAEAALDRLDAGGTVTLERRWADLLSRDEGKVARGFLGMAAASKETVAFLQGLVKKKSLKKYFGEDYRVAQLIADLGHDQARQEASNALIALGEKAVPAMKQAAADPETPAEAKQRLEVILRKLASEKAGGWRTDSLRVTANEQPPSRTVPTSVLLNRVVLLLEHIGTDEAKGLLPAVKQASKEAVAPDGQQRAGSNGSSPGQPGAYPPAFNGGTIYQLPFPPVGNNQNIDSGFSPLPPGGYPTPNVGGGNMSQKLGGYPPVSPGGYPSANGGPGNGQGPRQ